MTVPIALGREGSLHLVYIKCIYCISQAVTAQQTLVVVDMEVRRG